jgi:hypothetical protein
MCAEVHIPAFTKGKNQLSAKEVESTRKIANVRIHVERVIGYVTPTLSLMSNPLSASTRSPGNSLLRNPQFFVIILSLARPLGQREMSLEKLCQ